MTFNIAGGTQLMNSEFEGTCKSSEETELKDQFILAAKTFFEISAYHESSKS